MPQFRTIAAMLAMSALLLAGWTKATHFHSGSIHIGAAHVHIGAADRHLQTAGAGCLTSNCPDSQSERPGSFCDAIQSNCCTSSLAENVAVCAGEPAGHGPMVSASGHRAHAHGSCLICDFLSGQSDGLVVSFQFAGMVAAGSALSELLHTSPAHTLCEVSCRGPPALA